jgi:8-oxo-dGTP pyrophosphatase MutT (NUDIX family)
MVTLPPEAKRVFTGQIFDVYQWKVKMPNGSEKTFEMLKRPDTVKVLSVKDDRLVVLHERPIEGGQYYNLPGGRHDRENETELDAARREVLEETGLTFGTWELLYVDQSQPKIDYLLYLFLATDPQGQISPRRDDAERITMSFLTFDEVKRLLNDPATRYVGDHVMAKAGSLQELLTWPAYRP